MNAANLNYHRTAESKRRQTPRLKALYGLIGKPGMLQLAGGTPNAAIFPFDGLGATTLTPPFCNGIVEDKMTAEMPLEFQIFEKSSNDDINLQSALQYGPAAGDERLRAFMKRHMDKSMAKIPYKDWDLAMSVGNTFSWDAVLRTFCEPTDTVFFEEFTFPSALENCQNRGCNTVGVKLDDDGINMADLEEKLKIHHPKLLYTIPTGQNPTGILMSVEKRSTLMQLARKYDFLVLEDDPYYYLQLTTSSNLVPPLLDYDLDGRVIRLDSFSKLFAPGIRLGWITAQARFIQAIEATAESSSSRPSGFAETLVYGVLQRWGQDGFVKWLTGLRAEYKKRSEIVINSFLREIPENCKDVRVIIPDAGMFFWIEIKGSESPRQQEHKLFEFLVNERNVLVVPGHWCKVDDGDGDCMYLRGTFASASYEDLEIGGKKLAKGILEFLEL